MISYVKFADATTMFKRRRRCRRMNVDVAAFCTKKTAGRIRDNSRSGRMSFAYLVEKRSCIFPMLLHYGYLFRDDLRYILPIGIDRNRRGTVSSAEPLDIAAMERSEARIIGAAFRLKSNQPHIS